MKAFQDRDPVRMGLAGVLLVAVAALVVLGWDHLPALGGTTYQAQFREAAGLKPDDEVRVAGVKVGVVTSVELTGTHVTVTFRARDVWLGDQTVAAIKIKTLLGQKNLALDPLGTEELDPDTPIPLDRTVTAYDVTDAFADLAKTTGQIDTGLLAESFRTLSQTFDATTPQSVRTALDGLSRLSHTISSRDQDLKRLLESAKGVSTTLADRGEQFQALITDGDTLLTEFARRRDAISGLLTGTRDLSRQLSGLVAENQAQLAPALRQLERVTEVLRRNQDDLDRGLRLAGPFYRLVGNAVGNGHWIDSYICGLIPVADGSAGCVPPKAGGR
ncbi:MCE family protein [Actinokineospora cianjurensis]|uniref:Phospholipid/cholesterol/gamma-HCH transport system substrate-binding protein n=1 Tax=Actinokineospora cianjurensis TaxID=585224 RepID=A0A421AW46_9PSEU|nr:MCE family protein [Actinokineospora cianjurensis]RLK53842.1 phospholipid/cholesterol/gamma-HCH transport system substrate-binding protein [Actinokineospora cianjurensis]